MNGAPCVPLLYGQPLGQQGVVPAACCFAVMTTARVMTRDTRRQQRQVQDQHRMQDMASKTVQSCRSVVAVCPAGVCASSRLLGSDMLLLA
jgi:hypothetical protein